MGGCIIIPKTEDTLPENGGEVDLKTASLGSATRGVKPVLSPGTNTSGCTGKELSSCLFSSDGFEAPEPRLVQH